MTDLVDSSGGWDACWPWTASLDKNGYGEVGIKDGSRPNGTYFAHRIALEVLGFTKVSDIDKVRHSCDNPPCCNPKHLLVGTQADNVRDMIARGRQADYSWIATGEDHPMAKISAKTARDIFDVARQTYKEIAEHFSVSEFIVQHIKSGRTWGSVTGAKFELQGLRLGETNSNARLNPDAVREIRAFTGPGRIMAARFGISEAAVSMVRRRRTWTHVD